MAYKHVAFLCPQGSLHSRKLHDPSGFVLQSPFGTKTFRTISAAVAYGVEKGCVVKPPSILKPHGLNEWYDVLVDEATGRAEAAIQARIEAQRAAVEAENIVRG